MTQLEKIQLRALIIPFCACLGVEPTATLGEIFEKLKDKTIEDIMIDSFKLLEEAD